MFNDITRYRRSVRVASTHLRVFFINSCRKLCNRAVQTRLLAIRSRRFKRPPCSCCFTSYTCASFTWCWHPRLSGPHCSPQVAVFPSRCGAGARQQFLYRTGLKGRQRLLSDVQTLYRNHVIHLTTNDLRQDALIKTICTVC